LVYSQRKRQVREKISKETVKKKRISGEAYNINKQTIYTSSKSKIESRANYAPEPTQGSPPADRVNVKNDNIALN